MTEFPEDRERPEVPGPRPDPDESTDVFPLELWAAHLPAPRRPLRDDELAERVAALRGTPARVEPATVPVPSAALVLAPARTPAVRRDEPWRTWWAASVEGLVDGLGHAARFVGRVVSDGVTTSVTVVGALVARCVRAVRRSDTTRSRTALAR